MVAPLSWLKEYIDISLKSKELGNKLTEIGLGCEKIIEASGDTIFELEITPNRPDLLSIIGLTREIAAIEQKKIRYPKLETDLKPKKSVGILPLKIHPNYKIIPRLTGIIINNVNIKESPKWLKERLESIGQKPINNIVDITNYVMWELGNPIHSFDYRKIKGAKMRVTQAKGGEKFESVDEISYRLPRGAIIYEDSEKIFDLVGIKGGKNSGTFEDTKAVFIVVEVDDPVLIRRTSQALGLRSAASAVFERGVNRGGTIDALRRTVDLILETAGGEIASELIDLRREKFEPWKLSLRIGRLNKILGIEIPQKKVLSILENLNLNPALKKELIECTIPTYRNDLKIEEDLIEEVARLYGYNNFPKTLPAGSIPTKTVPYARDFRMEEKIKSLLTGAGFSEIYSYSLVSEKSLSELEVNSEKCLRVDNPVSLEFEYLRPTLKIGLINAMRQNEANFEKIELFELGKVYLGSSINQAEEPYFLSGISNVRSYFEIKGILERLLKDIGAKIDVNRNVEVREEGIMFELNLSRVLANIRKRIKFTPVPKYPPIIEDLSFSFEKDVKFDEIADLIKKQSGLVNKIELIDEYQTKKTFRIIYQSTARNLTNDDVGRLREKIMQEMEHKFKAKLV